MIINMRRYSNMNVVLADYERAINSWNAIPDDGQRRRIVYIRNQVEKRLRPDDLQRVNVNTIGFPVPEDDSGEEELAVLDDIQLNVRPFQNQMHNSGSQEREASHDLQEQNVPIVRRRHRPVILDSSDEGEAEIEDDEGSEEGAENLNWRFEDNGEDSGHNGEDAGHNGEDSGHNGEDSGREDVSLRGESARESDRESDKDSDRDNDRDSDRESDRESNSYM
jgi:hypothetical protein